MSKWMIGEDKLDEGQKLFINEQMKKKQNVWIQGFAGSGKSVLLVHAISNIVTLEPSSTICVVVFTHSLKQMFEAGMKEIRLNTQNITLTTYHQFRRSETHFDYIFCDEVQDLPKSVLENMKLRTKQLTVGGDANQSIYKSDPESHELTATPSEIEESTASIIWGLNEIHRLTKSLVKAIASLIPTMDMLSAKVNKTTEDVTIRLFSAKNSSSEVRYIINKAKEAITSDENVVIILPTHDDIVDFVQQILKLNDYRPWVRCNDKFKRPDYSALKRFFEVNKIDIGIEYIGNGYNNLYECVQDGKIIIMTYHSSKGLDFDNVFLPYLNTTINPLAFNRTLFMVGMTRSKKDLTLTYSETMHEYLKDIENECIKGSIEELNNTKKVENDDVDF